MLSRNSSGPNEDLIKQLSIDHELRREAVTQAEEKMNAVILRVGVVRALLRRKGLPLVFGNDTQFGGFPPQSGIVIPIDGNRSDESDEEEVM